MEAHLRAAPGPLPPLAFFMTFGSLPHTGRDRASGPFHSEVTRVEGTLVSKQSWEGVRLQVAANTTGQ